MKRTAATVTIALALVALAAGSAVAADRPGSRVLDGTGGVRPQHDVVCVLTIGSPWKNSGGAMVVNGQVECNDAVDVASTTIQLQYKNSSGNWVYYGNPVTSSSTAAFLNINDSAGSLSGCRWYRGVLARSAFHGNWADTRKVSGETYSCA
jgi:hypothetical protein